MGLTAINTGQGSTAAHTAPYPKGQLFRTMLWLSRVAQGSASSLQGHVATYPLAWAHPCCHCLLRCPSSLQKTLPSNPTSIRSL